MLTFLTVALSIYGAMHLYALSKVWLAFPHTSALTLTLVLWGMIMTFSPLMVWQLERLNWHHATVVASWIVYIWMGVLFLFCSISVAFDLGHALATLLAVRWPLNASLTLLIIGLSSLTLLGYGLVDARRIKVERIKIATPKLYPAIGRVTLVQISDLHLGVMLGDEFLDRVIAKLRELQPDIIVATGDIVDGQGDDFVELAAHFQSYTPPKGAYAIIGNHEVYAGLENSLRFLSNAGFKVLRGESAAAGGIILVGVDDPAAGALGQGARVETKKALASGNKEAFIVLLKHQPVVDDEIPFDLQLSGHIHGGQMFPFGLLTRLAYGVSTGFTQLADRRLLYVSRGAGTWGPPIRLLASPEITLITIESKSISPAP
jgi:predicted MPP superfamily phosphohydrolase